MMLTIGTIAKRVGLRPSAVRYYEARGLLNPATRLPNGYRIYDEDAVSTLSFVRRAQGLGITLKEVGDLLELVRRGRRPCARVQELARYHVREIDLKIQELERLRRELRLLSSRKPPRSRRGLVCPLIERG